ncbi:hypothetical protein J4Q44_G00022730 [Coregonus suidteri]|uniref:C2H2-type domain-containing protein n=2 Tax=Coregonus TaxID=27772 RepID=A0AAN8R786_9TELE
MEGPPVVEAGTKLVMESLTQPVETVEQAVETEEQPKESAAPEEWELDQPEDAQKETHGDYVAAGDRKNIPPKKNRMEPLKMDMSRPPKMVMPLTSSQISLQCLECHIIFSDQKSKERHLKQSHPAEYEQCILGGALFTCYVCDRHFTNSSDLMLHQRAHTEKQPFKCPICGEAFSRSSELTLHKKVHFGEHGYTCSDCGKPCKTLTLLNYHRRTHTGERPYVCKECGKRFSMSKALQKHALAHSLEGMVGEVGGITPLTKAQLKKNSGTAAVKFPCSMCKATFKTAKTRLHHMKHKHSLCVTAPSSSSTLAGQQVKPGQPIITQAPMGQPTFLHMEPLGPHQQVDNIDTEQIRKLIESMGNVRKVNQVVILGQPKTSRKRKAPKVETEGIISGSHSRRALECKDCGERFSDVSSLQEHKAALHAVESPGLTYTNGNIFEGVSGSKPLLSESLSPPHLTPIAPFHSCHQTEDTKSESQGNMNDTADALIPTVSGSEHLGPIEDEIKEELLLEVDLVTVGDGDQNEGEHQSSPHEDSSHNEGSSLHDNNSTHALPTPAQIENVNRTVTTQNAQTESCPSDPLEIKQEEEEIMVHRREEEKREVGRKNYTRGRRRGVGRGRRGSATRKSLEGEGMREMEPEKETDECRVVYQLYSLTNDTEIKDEADVTTLHPGQSSPISLQTEIRSISEQNTQTAPCPSRSCIPLLEEDPEDQVVFELESVTTSVVEVLKTEDGMVMKGVAGDQEQQRHWPIPRHHTGEVPHLKAERGSSRGEWSGAHGRLERHTVEQRGVRMYLVKQENNLVLNDPQVSHGQSQLNVEQSSARQCIFYPVKEEESELLEEPSQSEQGVPVLVVPGESRLNHPVEDLSITNPAVEEYEVNRRAAKLGTEINEYGEGDLDFEQQDTEELVDFLLQNSDAVESEVVECSDPQPDPEAVVMARYHDSQNHASLHSNEIPNNLPTTKSQADSGSTGGSQTGTGYMKPIDYFSKYFGWDTWAEIARCTNKVSHLSNPVTAKEVAQFVGIHIAMGTLKFPSLKLYWQDFTRVPLVADTMSASRFSQLSCKLQLASPAPAGDPMDTHEAGHSGNPDRPKEGDTTCNTLRALYTPANSTVGTIEAELDGSGHTLTSGHSQIQALSSKSVSAKSTTQTSTIPHSNWQRCGDITSSQDCFSFKTDPLWKVRPLLDHVRAGCLMLRREGDHGVDQYPLPLTCRAVNNKRPSLHSTVLVGSDGLILDFNLSLDLSIKEATVEKMVPREGMVYLCKQELSTPAMLEHLLGSGVHGAGKVGGAKGQMGDEFVSSDGRLMLHRYHLGFILSTVEKAQQNMASLVDSFEKAQKAASLNRDLINLYHSPLSASAPTSWPQAVLWYLTDLALVNSWMQYRQDHVPLPEPLNLMAFRLEVSKALVLSSGSDTQDSAPPHPPLRNYTPRAQPQILACYRRVLSLMWPRGMTVRATGLSSLGTEKVAGAASEAQTIEGEDYKDIHSPTMDSDILNIEEIVMGKGPPDPPAELTTEKPAEPYKPISSFKAPPPPTIQPYQHENLQCFQCFITFCNSKAKERHMKKSHREEYKQQLQQGDTLFTCYVCDRTFPSSEELTQHQGSHNKEDKPFKCPHCQESFRTFSELTTHRRQVCPERQFVCKDCSETFRSPALLRTHRLAQHPRPEAEVEEPDDPTKTHRCGKCNRGFETESELIMHQENHAGDQHCNGGASPAKKRGRPIKAEDTAVGEKKGKRRKKKEEGTEEAETGNNAEEAAAAPAETKGKAAAGGRRGRPKATAGEEAREDDSEVPAEEKKPKAAPAPPKQHPCPECELTFHALAQLRAHKKEKHTPRKAHPCEECEESFARAEQLEAHKNRAHTKGRYACPTCGKSFGRESNLKAHQQSSHPEEEEKEAAGRSKR